ncbi:hypothetical protein AYO22_00746 [Fonsecaea multimorphosa]|nr:hypothetical protein AYO22_00746 [Fonsecaea multimorphosa]
MRKADTTIPLKLGNLRQELEEERALLRYRCREGDPYGVFPSLRKRTRKQREVSLLLQSSIEKLWLQFKNIERPFLIGNSLRAEQVQRGDYWGESDIEEKPRARPDKTRTRDRVDLAEAGLAPDQQPRYYRTDLAHRFIWWQSVSAVEDMLNQVQRIQIRRMERDAQAAVEEAYVEALAVVVVEVEDVVVALEPSEDVDAVAQLVSTSEKLKKRKSDGYARRVADLERVKQVIQDGAATEAQRHGMSTKSFTREESLLMWVVVSLGGLSGLCGGEVIVATAVEADSLALKDDEAVLLVGQ